MTRQTRHSYRQGHAEMAVTRTRQLLILSITNSTGENYEHATYTSISLNAQSAAWLGSVLAVEAEGIE